MDTFSDLEKAVASLGESIAGFPVGAISANDLKPTEERIQDIRMKLKSLRSRMLILKAKEEAQKSMDLPEGSEQDTYDELQERIAHCTINNLAVESCLQNSVTQEILENAKDNELSKTLGNIMQKMFCLNDNIMSLEQIRANESAKEIELKCQLQESLSEFRDFSKKQERIRNEKLRETNPEIARQKESIQRRLRKINIMKRLITNFAAASPGIVKENPILREMCKNHRELLNIDTIHEMAKAETVEDS